MRRLSNPPNLLCVANQENTLELIFDFLIETIVAADANGHHNLLSGFLNLRAAAGGLQRDVFLPDTCKLPAGENFHTEGL